MARIEGERQEHRNRRPQNPQPRSVASWPQLRLPRPALRSPLSRNPVYQNSGREFTVSSLLGGSQQPVSQSVHTISTTQNGETHQGTSGTPESIRDSLPVSKYKESSATNNDLTRHKIQCGGRQCIICLENLRKNQLVRWLPCVHTFHVNCIDSWLRHSTKCPVCQCDVRHPSKVCRRVSVALALAPKTTAGNAVHSNSIAQPQGGTAHYHMIPAGNHIPNLIVRRQTHQEESGSSPWRRQPPISVSKLMMYAGALPPLLNRSKQPPTPPSQTRVGGGGGPLQYNDGARWYRCS